MTTGRGTKPEAQYVWWNKPDYQVGSYTIADLQSAHVDWNNSARVHFLDPLSSNVTDKRGLLHTTRNPIHGETSTHEPVHGCCFPEPRGESLGEGQDIQICAPTEGRGTRTALCQGSTIQKMRGCSGPKSVEL